MSNQISKCLTKERYVKSSQISTCSNLLRIKLLFLNVRSTLFLNYTHRIAHKKSRKNLKIMEKRLNAILEKFVLVIGN